MAMTDTMKEYLEVTKYLNREFIVVITTFDTEFIGNLIVHMVDNNFAVSSAADKLLLKPDTNTNFGVIGLRVISKKEMKPNDVLNVAKQGVLKHKGTYFSIVAYRSCESAFLAGDISKDFTNYAKTLVLA